jgi:phytoene desaturase
MIARIVGSGVAGIATSIRLAHAGYRVFVHEANGYPGGKLTAFDQGGYRFDAGPSLFTMPFLVDELFKLTGRNPKDYFNYKRLEKTCHYFWEDGTVVHGYAQPKEFANEVFAKLGVQREWVLDFLKHSAMLYDRTAPVFLEKSLHKLSSYLSEDVLRALVKVHKFNLTSTMNEVNTNRLKHPKLVQLFNRFATYNGSNPYKAPGVLSIIPHLEHNQGAYFPEGGMHAITGALVQLAQDLGVTFVFNQRVSDIRVTAGKADGIRVNGEWLSADLVVSNMDVVPTYRKLLKDQPAPERTLKQERSSSALIFYWGIADVFPELDVHNILFTEDYQKEFAALFDSKTVVDDPTVYIHISSKAAPEDAPAGCENWFVMINVPGNNGQDWDTIIPKARKAILEKLSRMLGRPIEPLIQNESILEPRLIEERTSSYTGALYGSSSNTPLSAFWRHPNFSQRIKNLYFCGGSVHPGGGIPLCLLSAKIVGDLVPKAS